MILVRSGTTVENYQTCSYVKDGQVFFDKSREPNHLHKALYIASMDQWGATYFAFQAAMELSHVPCVMEGLANLRNSEIGVEKIYDPFLVKKIWIPNGDWQKMDYTQPLEKIFKSMNPLELL